MQDTSTGKTYFANTVGGVKAYLPIDLGGEGYLNPKAILAAFTSGIGVSAESGSLADGAAFKYEGSGSTYKNLIKYAAKQGSTEGNNWYIPPIDIAHNTHNVIFRYAGLAIVGKENSGSYSALAITNPDFPSDAYQEKGSENPISATIYDKTSDKNFTPHSQPAY